MPCVENRPSQSDRLSPEMFAEHLDRKLNDVLGDVERTETYRRLADPGTGLQPTAELLKNILLEVFSYGPHIIEASFAAIGRLLKHLPDLMKPMLLHTLEEVDHSEMALTDYVKLGGFSLAAVAPWSGGVPPAFTNVTADTAAREAMIGAIQRFRGGRLFRGPRRLDRVNPVRTVDNLFASYNDAGVGSGQQHL